MKNETIKEFIDRLVSTKKSTDKDARVMQALLHKMGFPAAKVVLGVVYLNGRGTIDAPPMSIHTVAAQIQKGLNRQKE